MSTIIAKVSITKIAEALELVLVNNSFGIDTSKASKDIGSISRRASFLRNYFPINLN